MGTKSKSLIRDEFQKLFEEHNQALSAYCRTLCGDEDDAKDLMSETILNAFQNFEKIKDLKKFKFYLFGIASRLFKKQLRRKKIVQFTYLEDASRITEKELNDEKVALKILFELISTLKKEQAEILILKEVSGFTTKEIAEMLDMNENTVKTNLSRGKQSLREKLGNEFVQNLQEEGSAPELKNSFNLKSLLL